MLDLIGWFRTSRRAPWRPLVEGNTLDETHARLLAATHEDSQETANRMILPRGKHPDMVLNRMKEDA